MWSNLPLFPQQASTLAGRVDSLYFFMVAVTAFFSVLIATLVITFTIRYRRRAPNQVGARISGSIALELVWTLIPFCLAMTMFVWGTSVYFALARPPANAEEIYVVGKRWMWKFQHLSGQREINELHVPVGQPVKLLISSEDVIHSVYVPAFRQKMDAVPGRWTTLWFEASKPGRYHLFCAEYCGQRHSAMVGSVVAMEPSEFQAWLAGGTPGLSMEAAGERLFNDLACVTCHLETGKGRGPTLQGLFGKQVKMMDGSTVVADENYIRESILQPQAKIVAGYPPLMPTFQGLVTEEQLFQLTAYIKSLAERDPSGAAAAVGGAAAPATPQPQPQGQQPPQ